MRAVIREALNDICCGSPRGIGRGTAMDGGTEGNGGERRGTEGNGTRPIPAGRTDVSGCDCARCADESLRMADLDGGVAGRKN